VLAPKILGARHLHELTRNRELDLFVLFSSATTPFGNPGQASYVAANACLEALAEHRRGIGLCATCVGWGPIDDVGFLARNEKTKEALESRMGGSAINSAIALDALEGMLLADRSGLAVLELDWHALSRLLPTPASPKFRELAWHAEDRTARRIIRKTSSGCWLNSPTTNCWPPSSTSSRTRSAKSCASPRTRSTPTARSTTWAWTR
jgi:phthiocerol/phenolphthiocerol synthesis type-I polyketide synthase C